MGGASDCGVSGRNEKAERAGSGETSGASGSGETSRTSETSGSGEMSAISGRVSCTGKDMMPLAGL